MTEFHGNTIDKMFEFNRWANIELIKICQSLNDEQLSFEVDGAYGGIRSFLAHIVGAEGFYIYRLTGSKFWDDDLNWDDLPLATLLERARLSGQQLIDIASNTNPDVRHESERQGQAYIFHNWTVLVQAILHGVEHRTPIKVLLTHLGIEHSDLAVWDYMASLQ